MGEDRRTYVNTTQGFLGVIRINRRGDEQAISLEPGERIALSEEERRLTAEAPRTAEGNPFTSQPFEVLDPNTLEVQEKGERAPLELVTEQRPVGPDTGQALGEEQEVAAAGSQAPTGAFQPGEEVGPA